MGKVDLKQWASELSIGDRLKLQDFVIRIYQINSKELGK